jgi:cell division protein FtsL
MTTALQYKLAVANWQREQLQEQIEQEWQRLITTETTAEVRERVVKDSIRAKAMLKEFGLPAPVTLP